MNRLPVVGDIVEVGRTHYLMIEDAKLVDGKTVIKGIKADDVGKMNPKVHTKESVLRDIGFSEQVKVKVNVTYTIK